jgi:5-dehydro-2-deoxygluconokinase
LKQLEYVPQRPLAAIALGRAGVDLYPHERHATLAQAASFEKHVGGSPANIAAAMGRLGSKVGFLGRVSRDQLGQYVLDTLRDFGVDTSQIVHDDSGSRTSLAFAELRPADCDVVIYRNNAADLLLCPSDVDEAYVAQASALVVSGTALSASPSREAVFTALGHARRHGTVVVFDIDYRPYSWQSPEEVSVYCGLVAEQSDIIIGNREEFDAVEHLYELKGDDVDARSAQHWLAQRAQLVIVKRGPRGCTAYDRSGDQFLCPPFPVEAMKPVGAGDAFAGAMLHDLLRGETIPHAVTRGAAAAALVVSRSSCSDASPTEEELTAFLKERKNHALAR